MQQQQQHTSLHPDAILAIAWSARLWGGAAHCGIIIFDDKAAAQKGSGGACHLPHLRGRVVCGSEVEAVAQLQLLVEELDPDVVCGFDIQRGSIGYILDRCAHMRWVPCDLQLVDHHHCHCSCCRHNNITNSIIIVWQHHHYHLIHVTPPCSASPSSASSTSPGTPCFPSLLSRLKGAAGGVSHGRDEYVMIQHLRMKCFFVLTGVQGMAGTTAATCMWWAGLCSIYGGC